MTRVAPLVPAESDILCQTCGYTLNGLPETGNCPECGEPIAASTSGDRRAPPAWERDDGSRIIAFAHTTCEVLFRPRQFYRTLPARSDGRAANRFAWEHLGIVSILFSAAAVFHAGWYLGDILGWRFQIWPWLIACSLVAPLTYFSLFVVTRLAAKLTAWEAAYRGIRLPYPVVLRALNYHAAHYLPVAAIACVTVLGFQWMWERGIVGPEWATTYLYLLCAEVVLGAIWLFHTYWIAMRNLMYANR